MTAETIEQAIRDLVAAYGDGVRTAHEGIRTLVRVSDVELPPGCQPSRTPMLIVFDRDQAKPIPHVQPEQLLANGRAPRSTSTQIVGGESWMQFSFNIPWAEGQGIIRSSPPPVSGSPRMTEAALRVPVGLGHSLREEVFRQGRHEYVALGLVASATLAGGETLLLRRIFTLPEDEYVDAPGHDGAWRGAAMIPAIEAAVDGGLGLVVFHAHAHDGPPRLSGDDRESAGRLLPMFAARVPGRPHGSVVLSRSHAAGLIAMPGAPAREMTLDVRWLGASIVDWRAGTEPRSSDSSLAFARQRLVVHDRGQLTLGGARVAVVGLGGGGSHVAQQLAHLGVGELILVDPDRVSRTDRHRLVGMMTLDVLLRQSKTRMIRRAIRRIGMGTRCEAVTERIPGPVALAALARTDVIVGCVDNLHARADLQELAWRFLIPYVDVGVNIRAIKEPEPHGPRVAIGGNVLTLIPGGFCMWCSGFLSKEKLATELRGPDRSYFENREGEAQVVSLNGLVASQAVTEVLQLFTGFGGTGVGLSDLALDGRPGTQRGFRKLDGVRGTLEDWGAWRRPDCSFCNSTLAAGVVAWKTPR